MVGDKLMFRLRCSLMNHFILELPFQRLVIVNTTIRLSYWQPYIVIVKTYYCINCPQRWHGSKRTHVSVIIIVFSTHHADCWPYGIIQKVKFCKRGWREYRQDEPSVGLPQFVRNSLVGVMYWVYMDHTVSPGSHLNIKTVFPCMGFTSYIIRYDGRETVLSLWWNIILYW